MLISIKKLRHLNFAVFSLQKLEILNLSGLPLIKPDGDILTYEEFNQCIRNYPAMKAMSPEEREQVFSACDVKKTQALDRDGITKLNEMLYERFGRFGHDADENGTEIVNIV